MGLSRDEILDLASRYISPDEVVDFPYEGDVFCLLSRQIPQNQTVSEEEGWSFSGYGICVGYTVDEEAKPRGKWLWMHFASLVAFPPVTQVLKLQPPHVVKGNFQNAERSHDIRIIKINTNNVLNVLEQKMEPEKKELPTKTTENSRKIVQFRRKNTAK